MQGFTQRQLEQLRGIVKDVIIQLYEEQNAVFYLRVPKNVQKPECEPNPSQVGAPGHYESMSGWKKYFDNGEPIEPKPKISEHLYNNGRYKCCCEICTCGFPRLK